MKKSEFLYIVADVLTLARFVAAFILVLLATTEDSNSAMALICFVAGELCDALDGSTARLARREEIKENPSAPEPNRDIWVFADQVMDVLLGVAVVIYVWIRIDPIFAWPVLCIGGPIAVLIQLVRQWDLRHQRSLGRMQLSPVVNWLVLARRWAYVIILSFEILVLVWASPLTRMARAGLIFLGIFIGVLLCTVKVDRLTQDKTPLSDNNEGRF